MLNKAALCKNVGCTHDGKARNVQGDLRYKVKIQ